MRQAHRRGLVIAALLAMLSAIACAADEPPTPCWLKGLAHQALCGVVERPLNPAQPQGVRIGVHYAVLPALARNKHDDAVFFFAGGPGQSAIDLAGPLSQLLARLGNRRDIVLVDQRGSGRSAPLRCAAVPPTAPLSDSTSLAWQVRRLRECGVALSQLPYGDLRRFDTALAAADADAVRHALNLPRIDLIAASYGTRLALDYMRQFPTRVRRAVLDGVAPPDMRLPFVAAADNQAAWDALVDACAAAARCRQHYPRLRLQWRELLASLPRDVEVAQPFSGHVDHLSLTRDVVLGLVRAALYTPVLSSGLPAAILAAREDNLAPLVGLAAALAGSTADGIAEGLHFSVICSEDMNVSAPPPTPDFGEGLAPLYRQVCRDWPRAVVPEAFYRLGRASAATLLLSGGLDPVTPPRHAERVVRALGPLARQVVVANAGHGLLSLPCLRDVVFHFIDAADDAAALAVDTGCAAGLPRPPVFVPIGALTP